MSTPTTDKASPAAVAVMPDDGPLALKLFDRIFHGPSWAAWRAWSCGVFAQPMTDAEATIWRGLTSRTTLPTEPAEEAWMIAGRRSGKSRQAAFLVTFLAAVRQWKMAGGERPVVLLISPSRRQARVVLDYAVDMLSRLPGADIVRRTVEEVELQNRVTVRIESASFRTPRGFSVVGLVADEIAMWRDDNSQNPDSEILAAVRPPLVATPGSLLVAIGTPYSTKGEQWRTFDECYGVDGPVMVGQAPTTALNPTIPPQRIARALQRDPSTASAEWLGQFRSDLESLFTREALAAVVVRGRFELPPLPGQAYVGFIDAAGGSGTDSMTCGVAHRDVTGKPVLDVVREAKPPFSPEAVCQQFAKELKRYGVVATFSDRYAAQWPIEQFAKQGVVVQPSELNRSELYLELVPMVNSGQCELLDDKKLLGQLADLERRAGASGKDAIDHRRGQHDDIANAAAGALVAVTQAIGLKARIPSTFDGCDRLRSGLPALGGGCYLFHGSATPPNDVICKQCPGHVYVKAAREAYVKQTGKPISLPVYFREHCQLPEPLATAAALDWARKWAGAMGI